MSGDKTEQSGNSAQSDDPEKTDTSAQAGTSGQPDKITKDMSIMDIIQEHPETMDVFFKHGMHCLGCAVASFETLEQGAAAHGMDIDSLLEDLNKTVEEKAGDKTKPGQKPE